MDTPAIFTPGAVLPNGATVIVAKSQINTVDAPWTYAVVLAYSRGGEYVTWVSDAKGNTTGGHYYSSDDFNAAAASFAARTV
jgi:hypothetical protein